MKGTNRLDPARIGEWGSTVRLASRMVLQTHWEFSGWDSSRLREGRANTARGAAHFLRETVGRVRHAGAKGQLTVRADSGFYTHGVVSACRKLKVRFSITVRLRQSLRDLIEAIPEEDWRPIPYWMDGAAAVAETTYTPFQNEPDDEPHRCGSSSGG